MDGMSNFLINRYGFGDDAKEEAIDEDDVNLIQESFWSGMRASLFKKIFKGPGGATQWAYITGKKSRHTDGRRIRLSDKTIKYLEQAVDYLNSEEGLEELKATGILEAPDHPDSLIEIIANARVDRDIKREQFRLFLKHKYKIMEYLLKNY